MDRLKRIVIFMMAGAIFVTCKKEHIQPNTIIGQPVFSFVGSVNSNSLDWQAGVNNYYMYSSYTQDANNVYNFIGNLQSTNTSKNSIQFIINDYKVTPSNASVALHIDSSFSRPLYTYEVPGGINDTTYSITFTPVVYFGTPLNYSYNFGDGSPNSSLASPTHIYKASGTYTTSLTMGFSSGNVNMTNPITIYRNQPQLWIDSVSSLLSYVSPDTAVVNFTNTIQGGTPPYTYVWSYGDGKPSSSVSTNTTFTVSNTYNHDTSHPSHLYSCSLNVTDKLHSTQSYNYNIWDTNSVYSGGLRDYKMSAPVRTITSNTEALSNVTILYTDGSGNVYTSKNALQPNTSSFKINSVSDYQNNMNNQPTKMLNITFSCLLYDSAASPVVIPASGTAIIAVAYH